MHPSRALLFLAAAAILAPVPAQAKMPPFSVELDRVRPSAGETVTVTVRPKTSLRGFPDRMADLLAFEQAGERVAVPLARSGNVYRATVALPAPGRWRLQLFPNAFPRPGAAELARLGYLAPPAVEVVAAPAAGGRFSTVVLAVALAIAAAARAAGP